MPLKDEVFKYRGRKFHEYRISGHGKYNCHKVYIVAEENTGWTLHTGWADVDTTVEKAAELALETLNEELQRKFGWEIEWES